MCYSGANGMQEESAWSIRGQLEYDIAFLAFLGFNTAVHLCILMKSSIVTIKNGIKSKCCKKKQPLNLANPGLATNSPD